MAASAAATRRPRGAEAGPSPAARVLAVVVACILAMAVLHGAGQQRALLELSVNGVPHGVALVVVRGTELWVEVDALARADMRVPAGERETLDGREFVRLSSLSPAVSAVFDEQALTLAVTATPDLLGRREITLRATRPSGIEYRHDTSGFLNYGVNWTSDSHRSATLEGGFRLGVAKVQSLFSYSDFTGSWRGPTNVSFDRREQLQRWTVGDLVASTGPLGGALSLAGASVSRDYDLDPYFIRYPTVGLTGTVNAPATVDVYVNGRLLRQEHLPPGSFSLNDLPIPAGAGSARVVLRDAFGREQEIGGTYYVTTSLLARGLQQYQYAAGVERREPAYRSWDYGRGVFLATHRVGVTDSLTLGGRVEASSTLTSGGPQAIARLARFGEVEGAVAMSHGTRGTGYAWSASYLYVGGIFSAGAAWRATNSAYGTLYELSAPTQARLSLDAGATASTRITERSSATATWQRQRYHGRVLPQVDTLSLSATYRLTARTEVYATASRSRGGTGSRPSLFVGLTTGIGRRGTVGASIERASGRTVAAVDAQRSLPIGEGYGYRMRAAGGSAGSLDANLLYQNRFGRYEARQMTTDGQSATSLWASGSLVGIGGRLLASRPVEQSFALVRVPGVANVRAFVSHQEIGRTDRRGDLLVPGLLPYYGNLLSIADQDVPLDLTIGRRDMTLAPPPGGGAVALFPVTRELRVSGRVKVADHGADVVPKYGRMILGVGAATLESPIGSGGQFYFEGLEPGAHVATIEYSGGTCTMTLVVPGEGPIVRQMGLVTCLAR